MAIKPEISDNGMEVLKARYLQRDAEGEIVETPEQMFRRVAKDIAAADSLYNNDPSDVEKAEKEFYEMMASLQFLPNSPTLMNAGTKIQQLSACFVLPIEDSIESIFTTLKQAALIHQSGGGTGFSFTRLRPKGDIISTTNGVSSGPISFIEVFDKATDVIKQGGKRRGANMAVLRVDHPDILRFIKAKDNENSLTNFNISVAITDKFMRAVKTNKEYALINPKTKKTIKKISARKVFDQIAEQAWKNGEPGIIFIDQINKKNPTPKLGRFEATNPCGEQPLLPYESCNLGSINLTKFVKNKQIEYEKLKQIVHTAVHFLDNVIDKNKYPNTHIEKTTKRTRKIGLGIMGWTDMLTKLSTPYNSEKAINLAKKVMGFIRKEATIASKELARQRGAFPACEKSKRQRNATLTTIAPTGSISMIAGCSSSIEPLFAIHYKKKVLGGKELAYSNKNVFVTAHDVSPEYHVKMQAAFQRYTDNAVSKTVNLPNKATVEQIKQIYLLAYRLGCKGLTVYRDKSRSVQVLTRTSKRRCTECCI